ncbi:MAG: glycosyltransferase family 4 protein [Alphaproteobacteria bacterium]|nr:glycosyltransferase family 4 protein [Alphaproteobacteria bacterium]
MNILFLHQNMPGQFGHLAAHLARAPDHRVVFLTKTASAAPDGVTHVVYGPKRRGQPSTHHYLHGFEAAVLHGQAVARALLQLQRRGFTPELIVAHPGWGEPMFIKDALPQTKLVNYCEFFYRAAGADVGFDPSETVDVDTRARLRTRNAALMIALEACDQGIAATNWQRSVHPPEFHDKIEVVFDGVDADRVCPDPASSFCLPDGRTLGPGDQVVTYVARNLEPYRGFPSFMRALPRILEALPAAQIVIAGGDEVSYGQPAPGGETWRQAMLREVALPDGERDRVHFVGTLAYGDYVRLLQVSSAHVYLTYPFVLSWSAMEALAAGCLVIGSRTPPVEEVIRDGDNGMLVDFFAPSAIADAVIEAVRRGGGNAALRRRARETVLGRYDLTTCLQRQLALLERVTGRSLAVGERRLSERAA